MADYTPLEIVNIIKIVGECRDNYAVSERLYAERYPYARHPCRKTIRSLVRRAQGGHIKRQRRKRGPREQIALGVRAIVDQNPHISTRQLQRIHGVPRSTVSRTLRYFRFHPYHLILTQAIEPEDPARRLAFCRWADTKNRQDPSFFDRTLFSDEAKFDNNGEVNLHNAHYYAEQNPHWQRDHRTQRRWSLNVWAGIIGGRVIGPIFYDQNLNGRLYLDILVNQVPPLLEDIPLDIRASMWFQQDGAPAHRGNDIKRFLNDTYPNRWIGITSPCREFPPRSPDLTPLDFFLWGYVKERVFAEPPTMPENMRERIIAAFAEITPQTLINVQTSFRQRIRMCIEQNGNLIEHLRPC